jgi:hypothetical protein
MSNIIDVKKVDKALRGVPLDQRIGALIVNLCEEGGFDSIAAIQKLIATTEILGQNLPDETDRRCCATALRDCATTVEAEHRPLKTR